MKEKIYEATKGFDIDFEVSSNFSQKYVPLPIGGFIFQITKGYIDPTDGVCKINFEIYDGTKHVEKYPLVDKDGQQNKNFIDAVGRVIAGALQISRPKVNNKNLKKCIGRYIYGEIIHQKSNGRIYDHIDTFSIEKADGFNDADYVFEDVDEAEVDAADAEAEDAE